MMKYLRILVCGLALQCNALPALANFNMSPSGSTIAFAIDAGNQGTALCAAGSTECPASVPINTAGAPLFVSGTPGFVTGAGGTFPVTNVTAANLNATVIGTGTFAVQAGQTGTWTVQPGNTANTIAWLVTGTGGTFPSTQSGNWTSRVVGNTGTTLDFAGQNASTPGASLLTGCQFNTAPTTISNGNSSPIQCDTNGNALVNIKAGTVAATQSGTWTVQPGNTANTIAWLVTGTGGTFPVTQTTASNLNATVVGTGTFATQSTLAAETTKVIGTVRALGNAGGIFDGATGAAVPANVVYMGINNGGNLAGWNGAVTGTVTANAGTNLNTSALATSANQTNASQKTQIVDGSGNVIASTSNNLNVQCANCSGSGVSTGDEASFTAGTSLFAGGGGFFQTTATANALTTGQQGMFQVTANRALFTNLRNAAGTEVGTAGAPLQVSVANTAANGTAILVTGTGGTFPISGSLTANQSVNTAQVNGVTTLTGTGAVGTGAQRIAVGTDTATIAGSAPGTAGAASANVVTVQGIASMTKLLVTPDANSAVNVAQINGVTPLMGNGTTGTGSQRVTIASDNTAFAVNATLQASSATAIGTVNPTTIGNWGLQVSTQNSSTPTNGALVLAQFNTTPTGISSGNVSPLQVDTNGNLLVNIKAGAGSGGTAIADKAAWTVSSTQFTLSGGEFTTGGATACATAQACTVAMTASRGFFQDMNTWAETSLGVPTAYGTAPTTGNYIGVNAFVTNTNANGSATSANSSPVVIASDQVAVAVKAASGAYASGSVASGAFAAGSIAAGAYVSGSILSGALASGAVVDITNMSQTTGSAVPAKASYTGLSDGTNIRGWLNAANALNSTGAGIGTAQIVGQFDDVTPTAITENQFGNIRMSANRNVYQTIRDAAGNERGANVTASNELLVTGAVTIAGNQAVNVAQINGVTPLMGNGTTGTGSQRVTIASDNTAFAVNATLQTGANIVGRVGVDQTTPGTTNAISLAQLGANTVSTGNGASGTGTLRVAVASDNTAFTVNTNPSAPAVTTIQNAAVANGNGTNLSTQGYTGAVLNVLCSVACSGGTTINFEASVDNTTFVAIQGINVGTSTIATTTTTSGDWTFNMAGYSFLRARISAYSAGTISVKAYQIAGSGLPPVVNANVVANTATNQSTNVAQINGVTPLMGNGTTGTGSPRVTIASDNTAVAGLGAVATGSAPPTNTIYLGANSGGNPGSAGTTGGKVQGLITCDNHIFKHITTATDTFTIQGVTSQTIYICGWRSRAAGTATWYLENTASTNANCSSTLTQITGVASEVANSGETLLAPFWTGLKNTAGNGLCINSTGTGGVDVDIWYTQF